MVRDLVELEYSLLVFDEKALEIDDNEVYSGINFILVVVYCEQERMNDNGCSGS
jgi:hypothetical protein